LRDVEQRVLDAAVEWAVLPCAITHHNLLNAVQSLLRSAGMLVTKTGHFVEESALRCDLCSREVVDIYEATRMGWTWFTQYRKETFHACNKCQRTRVADVKKTLTEARIPRPLA